MAWLSASGTRPSMCGLSLSITADTIYHILFITYLQFIPMAVSVTCFYQPGCMGCMEQGPINREVAAALNISIVKVNAVKNPQYIQKYTLKVTPTIILEKDGSVKERFEGVVHREQLEQVIRKYL
jgi:thioredoxin 1